jgi:uncharacterized membrane protein
MRRLLSLWFLSAIFLIAAAHGDQHSADHPRRAVASVSVSQPASSGTNGELLIQLGTDVPGIRKRIEGLAVNADDRALIASYFASEQAASVSREARQHARYLQICSRADGLDAVSTATELTAARDEAQRARAQARTALFDGLSSGGRAAISREAEVLGVSGATTEVDLVAVAISDSAAFRKRLATMCEGLKTVRDETPRGIVGERAPTP